MQEVSEEYLALLDEIAQEMMQSEEYISFEEEEEEEQYRLLCEKYEPMFMAVHKHVATNDPLQLVAFEQTLLIPELQGVLLPKLLGFAVLRGDVNENFRFKRPQQHFKDVLGAICLSSNLEYLRKRTGQAIQIGFALSSDIWVTDFIDQFQNKKVRQFLQAQKLDRFRDLEERKAGFLNFSAQLFNENFLSTDVPTDISTLKVLFPDVMRFLLQRVTRNLPNDNVTPAIESMLSNAALIDTEEIIDLLALYINFFDHDTARMSRLAAMLNKKRQEPEFAARYFGFLSMLAEKHDLLTAPEQDEALAAQLEVSIKDDLLDLYQLLVKVHTFGFVNIEALALIREFYNRHEGASIVNQYLRTVISRRFCQFIDNVDTSDYHDYMDLFKKMQEFMHIFDNEAFNKTLKDPSMAYLNRLVESFPNRKGKEYLEVRRFVGSSFKEAHFMNPKEITEYFKRTKKA